MAKVKVKRKSTFIDMTAMSDVTVLLLTFFMLTSTFIQKEPVTVTTPGSVSEIKIPESDILQILVDPQGKVFMTLDKQEDRVEVLKKVGEEYGITFTRRDQQVPSGQFVRSAYQPNEGFFGAFRGRAGRDAQGARHSDRQHGQSVQGVG